MGNLPIYEENTPRKPMNLNAVIAFNSFLDKNPSSESLACLKEIRLVESIAKEKYLELKTYADQERTFYNSWVLQLLMEVYSGEMVTLQERIIPTGFFIAKKRREHEQTLANLTHIYNKDHDKQELAKEEYDRCSYVQQRVSTAIWYSNEYSLLTKEGLTFAEVIGRQIKPRFTAPTIKPVMHSKERSINDIIMDDKFGPH